MARRHHARPQPERPPWWAHRRLNDGGNPERFEAIRSLDISLQENLGGESGKVVLTGEAVGVAEEDSVDGGNFAAVEEGTPKSAS
jgi:hypothetical protein